MKAILIDVTRCQGCEQCVQACTKAHDLGPEAPERKQRPDHLSSRRLSAVVAVGPKRFAKKQCLHCLEPGCVGACPVGAIRKTPEGPVVYNPDKCMGCRYCMLACPVGIPRYEWDKKLPYMKKCDMCVDRLKMGGVPACVEACPHGACLFGDRGALLAEAHRRVSAGKGAMRMYGEKDLGGTSVLYVSDVPLEAMGWPRKMGETSAPSYTWPLISKTPWMAVGVAGILAGTTWVINRRMKLQSAGAQPADSPEEKTNRSGDEH